MNAKQKRGPYGAKNSAIRKLTYEMTNGCYFFILLKGSSSKYRRMAFSLFWNTISF